MLIGKISFFDAHSHAFLRCLYIRYILQDARTVYTIIEIIIIIIVIIYIILNAHTCDRSDMFCRGII